MGKKVHKSANDIAFSFAKIKKISYNEKDICSKTCRFWKGGDGRKMPQVVSLIVPIYKVSRYIEKCAISLFEQTIASDIEYIFVDDCTPDDSVEKLNSIAKKYPDLNIKIIHHETNQGLSAARNSGLDIASGEYILFVDSDDYVRNDYAEKLLRSIKETASEIAICMFELVYEDELEKKSYVNIDPTENLLWDETKFWTEKIINNNALARAYAWNKMYKKSIFAELRYPVGNLWEDEHILHKILSQCGAISVVPEILYFYLIRSDSITNLNKTTAISFAEVEVAFMQVHYFKEKDFVELHKFAFLDLMFKFSDIYIRFRKNEKFYKKGDLKRYFAEYDTHKKNWILYLKSNKKILTRGIGLKFKAYIVLFRISTPLFCFIRRFFRSFRH